MKNSKIRFKTFLLIVVFILLCKNILATEQSLDSSDVYFELRQNLEKVFTNNNLKNTKYSIYIYTLDNDKPIYSRNPDLAITPASCTKLFTTFAIYNLFNNKEYIETNVHYDGKISPGGILDGNIYIVGRGDALFNSSDLDAIVGNISKYGIKQINGNIYADDSFFDGSSDRFIYSGDLNRVENLQPITGLSLERNIATVTVSAGNNPSKSANVQINPASYYFTKNVNINIIKTQKSSPKKPRSKKKSLNPTGSEHYFGQSTFSDSKQNYGDRFFSNKTPTSKRGISISSPISNKSVQTFYISGSIRANSSYSYKHHIQNPPLAAAGALKLRLETAGIKVIGHFQVLDSIQNYYITSPIATVKRRMDELIHLVNKNSDNYIAENLFKIIGAINDSIKILNDISKFEISKQRMLQILRDNNISCEQCSFNDGSGLSRRNKISSKDIVEMLINVYNSQYFDRFYSSLAIAGVDGTLIKRMKGTKAENNLRGKTGTHRNVSSLAGYVYTQDGELIAFSMIFNGGNVGLYKNIENQVGNIISEFSHSNELSGK